MTRRIVLISDVQLPFDDRKALKAVIRFVKDYQPDELIQIGDLLDLPQPSRWNKGTKGEFEGSIFEDAEQCKRRFMDPIREGYDGPFGIHEGNHDLRGREYLAKYAPALAESGAFNIETLLDFDGYGVRLLPPFYDVAPGWLSTHGHLARVSMSRIAGNTAMGAARKFGKSVVQGHSHKLGVISETHGYGGKITQQLTGFELGHLMDQKLASYLQLGTSNWQLGFGILHVDGQHVKPEPVPIAKGRFTVDGHTWEI